MSELMICTQYDFWHTEMTCRSAILTGLCDQYKALMAIQALELQKEQVAAARDGNKIVEEEIYSRYDEPVRPKVVKPQPKASYTPPAQVTRPAIPGGMRIEPRREI